MLWAATPDTPAAVACGHTLVGRVCLGPQRHGELGSEAAQADAGLLPRASVADRVVRGHAGVRGECGVSVIDFVGDRDDLALAGDDVFGEAAVTGIARGLDSRRNGGSLPGLQTGDVDADLGDRPALEVNAVFAVERRHPRVFGREDVPARPPGHPCDIGSELRASCCSFWLLRLLWTVASDGFDPGARQGRLACVRSQLRWQASGWRRMRARLTETGSARLGRRGAEDMWPGAEARPRDAETGSGADRVRCRCTAEVLQARRTGRDSRPFITLTGRQRSSSGGIASSSPGKRASRAPRATSASMRARGAPRQ
jgi:hypothetical protein